MSGKISHHNRRMSPEVMVLIGFTITILVLLVIGAGFVSIMYSQRSAEAVISVATYTQRVATPFLPVTNTPSIDTSGAQPSATPAPVATAESLANPTYTSVLPTPVVDVTITTSAPTVPPGQTQLSTEPVASATTAPNTTTPTLALVNTLAPTNTPLTSSPTATRVTTTAGWDVVSLRSATDLNGWLLFGELINNTGSTRQIISIGGLFYDIDGRLLADSFDAFTRTPTNLVPIGGRLPFELSFVGIENVASYTLSVNAQVYPTNPRQDFEFTNLSQTYARERLCATSDFRNPGADLTRSLEIAMVLFDGEDHVINFSDAEVSDIDDVTGGQTLSVQVCIDPPNQNASRLEWRAWGR